MVGERTGRLRREEPSTPDLASAGLLVVAVSLGLPIVGSGVLSVVAPSWRLAAVPFHSVVEAVGGFIAITLAILLRLRLDSGERRCPDVWVGAALAAMGVLDIAHAAVEPGQSFVWLHSVATFAGGLFFAGTLLPMRWARSGRLDLLPLFTGVAALLLCLWAVVAPEALPRMLVDGEFTTAARGLNIAGGLLFFAAALRFGHRFIRHRTWDALLFTVHCALFGSAGVLFELSVLWDGEWWWWHALRLAAYSVAIGYLLLDYWRTQARMTLLNAELDASNRSLERRVAERTGELATANDRPRSEMAERERLETARGEARLQHAQKRESLGVLAGGIAHGFNNLLVGMLGNASMALQDTPKGHRARPALEQIELASRRAAELTRQMLAYSGKGRFVVEPLDLSEVVLEMKDLLEVSVSKRAALRTELADALPAVRADATQLRQVVMNLITNASDALDGEDGTVTLATGVIEAGPDYLEQMEPGQELEPGRYVFVEVSDTGRGMDEEGRVRMFDPFFTTKMTGRGLGLAATQGIVRGHQGAIRVYSEEGRGSAIKVLLPVAEGEQAVRSQRSRPPAPANLSGTVLVVDDHEIVRNLAGAALRRSGLTVIEASDGREALELYAVHGSTIDVVLLDLTMPRLSGEETFAALRETNPAVRVLLMSGYNAQDTTGRFVGKGLAGFLQKPFTSVELVRRVCEQLEASGS